MRNLVQLVFMARAVKTNVFATMETAANQSQATVIVLRAGWAARARKHVLLVTTATDARRIALV